MQSRKSYDYALSLSSQIPHCSLPLRLDSYSKCSFRCSYCFAKNRGGNHPPAGIKVINVKALDRLLLKSLSDAPNPTVVSQLLGRKVPIHFGGMSDPFMPYELTGGRTLETLAVLSKHQYPTIISTKGNLLLKSQYQKEIANGKFAIQVSFSTLDDEISKIIEINTIPPSERLSMIRSLSNLCWVSARLQPMIPGNLEGAKMNIAELAAVGVKHVSVEFLKIPFLDSRNLLKSIGEACGIDLRQFYTDRKASGLEFLINVEYAIHFHSELIKVAEMHNVTYSCADTDLLPYDGSDSCCSGTAEIKDFGNYYRYTFPQAIRNAIAANSDLLTHEYLTSEWAPSGSIKRFLNSKTRIDGVNDIERFMANKWNNATYGYGPLAFQGISDTKTYDDNGMKIFKIEPTAFSLARALKFNRFDPRYVSQFR